MTPTVGRIVQYRQRRGSQAWLPAIVTVDEGSFVAGVWVPEEPQGPSSGSMVTFTVHHATFGSARTFTPDAEGEVYRPSELPPVKEGRVHLRVLSPTCADYAEFNVAEGDEPGCWRWPPRVEG